MACRTRAAKRGSTRRCARWSDARSPAPAPGASAFDVAVLAGIPAPRLVFVNGGYQAAHSDVSGLCAGVDLRPLSNALAGGDARASSLLERRFQRADEVFARLNAALASEGLLLRVEAGVGVEAPLHLVSIGTRPMLTARGTCAI
jgi:Fe-S cluster assembly protein SufD